MKRNLLSFDFCVPVCLLCIACCSLVGVLITQRSMTGSIMSGVFETIDGRLGSLENRLMSLHANMDLQHQLAVSRADDEVDTQARIDRLQRTLSAILSRMHSAQHAGKPPVLTESEEEEADPGVLVVADDGDA